MRSRNNVDDEPDVSEATSLSAKQLRTIVCLLASRTNAEAAKMAEISEGTLYLWFRNPAFITALRDAQQEILESAMRRLVAGNPTALDALQDLVAGAKSEAVRRQAIMDWMNLSFRFLNPGDMDHRLKALEMRNVEATAKHETVDEMLSRMAGN